MATPQPDACHAVEARTRSLLRKGRAVPPRALLGFSHERARSSFDAVVACVRSHEARGHEERARTITGTVACGIAQWGAHDRPSLAEENR